MGLTHALYPFHHDKSGSKAQKQDATQQETPASHVLAANKP